MDESERVLCVPAVSVDDSPIGPGFNGRVRWDRFFDWLALHGEFRPRAQVEEDLSWRQIATYCLVMDGSRCVFRYPRSGGERRLNGRWSIGVGGHVNADDVKFSWGTSISWCWTIGRAVSRELDEELDREVCFRFANPILIGLIDDRSDPVGRHHLGCVATIQVPGGVVMRDDSGRNIGEYVTVDQLRATRDSLESWSRVLVDQVEILHELVIEL